jgi:hypothetical protein
VPPAVNVQGDPVTVPGPLVIVRFAFPVGVKRLGTSVSVTVTVQVVAEPTGTGEGMQTRLVVVLRG